MRKDMPKVIVERPRRGAWTSSKSRSKEARATIDEDNHPKRSSMKPRGEGYRKELNENLAPLQRYLDAHVGRPWDKVYSDMRKHLSPKNAVQMHIMQHIAHMVYTDAKRGDDGKYYSLKYTWHSPHELSEGSLFVDAHGTLRRYKAKFAGVRRRWRKKESEAPKNEVVIKGKKYQKIHGHWYLSIDYTTIEYNFITQKHEELVHWDCKQLNKRELKALNLKND